MTKAVLTALVAVVLGITAAPADARPLHSKGERRIEAPAACARILMVEDGERGDCTVRICRKADDTKRHRKHHGRKHHHRHSCLPQIDVVAQ